MDFFFIKPILIIKHELCQLSLQITLEGSRDQNLRVIIISLSSYYKSINQEPNNYWFNLSIFVWYLRPQQRVNGQIDGEITPHQMSEPAQSAHHSPDIDRYTHRSWTILSSWIFITQLKYYRYYIISWPRPCQLITLLLKRIIAIVLLGSWNLTITGSLDLQMWFVDFEI